MTREEIIKGLLGIHAVTANYKGDQVILHNMPMKKLTGILYGAAEMLEAQAPRALGLSEIPEHDGAVFIERKRGNWGWALYAYERVPFFVFTIGRGELMLPLEDYGTEWRCWTSRPSPEQREATPWH